MTVADRTSGLTAYEVKAVTELRHIAGAVFVSCKYLVQRINYYKFESVIAGPINDDRRQLIHGHRIASKVPDIYISQIFRLYP